MALAIEGVAEEMTIEVQGSAYPLDIDTLSKLAIDHLKLPAKELKDKSRLAIVKVVCNYMEEKVSKLSPEEPVDFLMDMKSAISVGTPALEGDAKKAMELTSAKYRFQILGGCQGRRTGVGGDNSIQFINFGRVGDKSFEEWRQQIGGWKGG